MVLMKVLKANKELLTTIYHNLSKRGRHRISDAQWEQAQKTLNHLPDIPIYFEAKTQMARLELCIKWYMTTKASLLAQANILQGISDGHCGKNDASELRCNGIWTDMERMTAAAAEDVDINGLRVEFAIAAQKQFDAHTLHLERHRDALIREDAVNVEEVHTIFDQCYYDDMVMKFTQSLHTLHSLNDRQAVVKFFEGYKESHDIDEAIDECILRMAKASDKPKYTLESKSEPTGDTRTAIEAYVSVMGAILGRNMSKVAIALNECKSLPTMISHFAELQQLVGELRVRLITWTVGQNKYAKLPIYDTFLMYLVNVPNEEARKLEAEKMFKSFGAVNQRLEQLYHDIVKSKAKIDLLIPSLAPAN